MTKRIPHISDIDVTKFFNYQDHVQNYQPLPPKHIMDLVQDVGVLYKKLGDLEKVWMYKETLVACNVLGYFYEYEPDMEILFKAHVSYRTHYSTDTNGLLEVILEIIEEGRNVFIKKLELVRSRNALTAHEDSYFLLECGTTV